MNQNVQFVTKSIELRRLGYSYSDIARELKISKASVCGWVKNVRLTETEKLRLQKNLKSKMERGRLKASIAIRSKNVFKEKVVYENAEKEFEKFIKDPLFMLGIGLCSAHGLKKGNNFQFVSPSPAIARIILMWVEKYLNLSKNTPKYRIFVATSHKNNECEQFWARNLGISPTVFQKTMYLPQNNKKGREYNGSLTLTISRIEVVRKVIAWQKLIMRYYG